MSIVIISIKLFIAIYTGLNISNIKIFYLDSPNYNKVYENKLSVRNSTCLINTSYSNSAISCFGNLTITKN